MTIWVLAGFVVSLQIHPVEPAAYTNQYDCIRAMNKNRKEFSKQGFVNLECYEIEVKSDKQVINEIR